MFTKIYKTLEDSSAPPLLKNIIFFQKIKEKIKGKGEKRKNIHGYCEHNDIQAFLTHPHYLFFKLIGFLRGW